MDWRPQTQALMLTPRADKTKSKRELLGLPAQDNGSLPGLSWREAVQVSVKPWKTRLVSVRMDTSMKMLEVLNVNDGAMGFSPPSSQSTRSVVISVN